MARKDTESKVEGGNAAALAFTREDSIEAAAEIVVPPVEDVVVVAPAPASDPPKCIVIEQKVEFWRTMPPHGTPVLCQFQRGVKVSYQMDIDEIVAFCAENNLHNHYSVIF